MATGGNNANANPGGPYDEMIIAGFVVAFLAGAWWLTHAYISGAYLWIKEWELRLVNMVVSGFEKHIIVLENINREEAGLSLLLKIGFEYMWFNWIFFVPLQIGMIVYLVRKRQHRTRMEINTLAEDVQEEWPNVIPILGKDLISADVEKGPHAYGRSPVEYCRDHGLIQPDGKVNPQRATDVLLKQLGPRFKNLKSFNWYELALVSVFMSYLCYRRKDGVKMLKAINFLNPVKPSQLRVLKPDIMKAIQQGLTNDDVKLVLKSHAYKYTLMYGLLETARAKGGVLATCEFIWLKPIDRHLWYVLNNVGRQVAWAEVSGVYSHYMRERSCKRSLTKPHLQAAINGFNRSLADIVLYEDDIADSEKAETVSEADQKTETNVT